MLKIITTFAFFLLICTSNDLAQDRQLEVNIITGDETTALNTSYTAIGRDMIFIENQNIYSPTLIWEMHNITNIASGWDMQSNASPQQLWYDINSSSLNAVFLVSNETSGWLDRRCKYFHSTDEGMSWSFVGDIPEDVRAGFPVIIGLSSGQIVISNHSSFGSGWIRPQLFINSSPGMNDFVNYDPGDLNTNINGPKLGVANNNNVIIGAAEVFNPDALTMTNTLNISNGTFSGWVPFNGRTVENYSFATSSSGKIGHAYLDSTNSAWFRESADNGLSWNTPTKIFNPFPDPLDPQIYHSAWMGISIIYLGEIPNVVFEVYKVDNSSSSYFPELPSEIYFWNPEVNNGNATIVADSNNVPFYPNQGVVSAHSTINRPVIGKTNDDSALFLAFFATSEDIATTSDQTRFMIGYFMSSQDGGQTWTSPERFTPTTNPPLDWRWVSIVPVNLVDGDMAKVNLVMVGDPIAGSQIFGAPPGVTAKFYHFSTNFMIIPVELTSFNANVDKNNVLLTWSTASETNNMGFEVERLQDYNITKLQDWEKIAFVDGNGTTTESRFYSYTDNDLKPGNYSYRLKQIDFDGTFEYSNEIEVEIAAPLNYSLKQNYPNPFNPSTKIEFQVPEQSSVSIKIYDVLGNEIATLVNSEFEAGNHSVEFDASSGNRRIASGIYYYRLQAGEFSQFRKMVLLK